MESSKSKNRVKSKVKKEELDDKVPVAPTLEDFVVPCEGQRSGSASGSEVASSSTSASVSAPVPKIDLVRLTPSEKEKNVTFSGTTFKLDLNVSNPVPEQSLTSTSTSASPVESSSLSSVSVVEAEAAYEDTSSSGSLDPCEEALTLSLEGKGQGQRELLARAEAPSELDLLTHKSLYPALPLTIYGEEEEQREHQAQWENVATPEKEEVDAIPVTPPPDLLGMEIPLHLFPEESELTSRIQHLYQNNILEESEEKVKSFLSSVKTSYDAFELYELVSNYQRAYNQLSDCERSLAELRERCGQLEKVLWSVDNQTLTESSSCMDGNVVSATHNFMQAKFNPGKHSELDKVLKGMKEVVKDKFSLYSYSVLLCRTQITHFFHKSFKDVGLTMLQSSEVQGYYSGYPNGEVQEVARVLRLSVSTLFIFLRRHGTHPVVRKDCLQWIGQCVGLLLRVATLDDHLFILNHVLRVPPGLVGKGLLASCVQVPRIMVPGTAEEYRLGGFSSLNLDYALTVLKTILNPIPERDVFLKQVETGIVGTGKLGGGDQWVVVDSDGEDDPEDVTFFKESDLISLLHQIPFDAIFRRILFVSKSKGTDVYDIGITSERNVLKLLAFGTQLINVLGQGFVAYYTDRYRQLIKMVGRLILHCVQYVTDHIDSLVDSDVGKECGCDSKGSLIRTEYDLFFRNAVGILYSGKNIGSLQFLAAMPFHLISSEMLWHVYCAVTKWVVRDKFQTDISSEFENELVSMNESDAFYLLTTLCNMAVARERTDNNFTRIVTIHLFQIGFLSPLTRDCCSKTARDLLGNLTRKYPEMISVLLHSINSKIKVIETFSLYLLKELAFELWVPTEIDMKLIFRWLVTFPVSSIENQTARLVLQSMNWNFDQDGKLFLSHRLHYEVALMVMESNMKWEKGNFIAEGMKQINPLASKSQDAWSWEMLKKLHLHGFDRKLRQSDEGIHSILHKMPTFDVNPELECIRKGIECRNPLACALSLYVTPLGHSVPLVCSRGLELLEILVQNYKMEPALHALFFLTPLFAGSPEVLHSNEKFRLILQLILAADMTYVRMAKNLISTDFPGEVTKLFGEMICAQISQCSKFETNELCLITLWTECLTKLDNWNKDSNVLYLLDVIAKLAFAREDCHSYFLQFFTEMYKNIPQSSQSGIASLFSWTTAATTLLPNPTYAQTPYFVYFILSIETNLENQTGFWKTLCIKLNNPKVNLDTAVKKSSHSSKLSTSTNFLTIYRWAQLVLDLPFQSELSVLVWQKFFLRYFHRVSGNQTTQYSCVASRFFEGMVNTAFYNKLRKKLNEFAAYCKDRLTSFEKEIHTLENSSVNPVIVRELLTDKVRLSGAMTLWIDDIQLLQPTLYLPALAPQFLPTMLMSLMDGEEVSWHNYVDMDQISDEERCCARTYITAIGRTVWVDGVKLPRFTDLRTLAISNCVDDLLKRLNSYDAPKEPPAVPVFDRIIPLYSPNMLIDLGAMKHGLEAHFRQLLQFSKQFAIQISQLVALNCGYLECLPELYCNSPAEMVVNARCSGRSGGRHWEDCAGPAQIRFQYTEAKLNESLGHQIHQNRIEYESLLNDKGTKPPPVGVCVAAVFVEDFITNLVMHFRATSVEGEERMKVSAVGSDLFYYASTLMNDDTDFYPPTRQLLSSLLEVLGHEFISTLPNQSHRLVTTAIRNPKLVGALAPHLNLASCSPQVLIQVYKEVVSVPKKNVDLAFVILTKFDINGWLKSARPKLNERSQLIQATWKALITDGYKPEESRLLVHDVYRNHLRSMLLFDFPQHYGEILALLLDGMEHNRISQQIWFDFCTALSRDTNRFFAGMDPIKRKQECKMFATEGCLLRYQELLDTAQLLSRHFTGERLANGLYGLYSKYRNYIEAISCFLQMVSYSIIAYSLKHSNGTLSQNIVDAVWPLIRDLYAPWMLPYNQKFIQQNCAQWIQHMNFDATNVLQPWISSDSQYAMILVNDFTDCLMFLVETLPGNSTIFSYIWNFYVENFALIGVKEHVVGVVHNCFISIPWAMFWPSFQDVELMCKIVEKFLPASHSFLSIVFAQISWQQWINALNAKLTAKGHAMLLNLTVRLGNDAVARESPTWIEVMDTAETKINWLAISPSGLEPILNWLVMSIDPRVVLQLDATHRMDKALLRLLETACGYRHPDQLSQNTTCNSIELNTKRYCFVRSYVRLIVSASSKHKNLLESQPKSFEDAIRNMVTELALSVKRENQPNDFYVSHLRELLNLMSNHTLGTIARNAVLEWCSQKDSHSLNFLLTVIQLSCGLPVKPYIVCPLVENLINLSFQYPESSWTAIRELTVVNPEEFSNYFDICSKDSHYLLLYSLMLRRFSSFIAGGSNTLCFFMDLLKNIKPKDSCEESLPLIYGEMLRVALNLHIEALSETPTNETFFKIGKKYLLAFAQHASLVGDDKQGWGLLGALGIGKSSQLSVRGRLFAKCLATFVYAQLPISSAVRIDPGSAGHFLSTSTDSTIKPHPEVQSCLEKLESLKQNRQHTDLIECIDFATEFIKDPNNALSSSELFISKLNGYLFSAAFLMRS